MAEDDDDDSFGEFTFASIHLTVNSASQIPVTTGDDEWGDFNFFQNDTTDHNLKSTPPQPQTQTQIETQTQPKWEKIKGALPLSLFGDDDEEDDKPAMPVAGEDVKRSNYSGNNGFVINSKSDTSNAHMDMNDLLANLYGQSEPQQTIKADDNGNNLDLSTINSTFTKDANISSDAFSTFSLHTVTPAAGNHGSDDEGGWEFMDASSDSKLTQIGKDNKERLEKTVSSPGLQDFARGHTDLFAAPNNGASFEYNVTHSGLNSNPVTNFQNGFTVDSKADSEGATHELSSNLHSGSDDFDDTFGEFETAFTEQPSTEKELSKESKDTWGSHDVSHRPVDLFAFSNGVPKGAHRNINGFDSSQSSVVQNGVSSDPLSQIGWMETKDDSDSQPPGRGSDDGNFRKFKTTFPEAGSKQEGYVASSKNYKEPVPLSIFGIEEDPQADSSLIIQHDLFKSSTHGKHTRSQSLNLSINDVLSDLYSQAEPVSYANHEPNPDGKVNLLHSTGKEYSPRTVDDDDDGFDDGSWEFKDASSQPRVENQNMSFKEKLENFKNLYSNMKDDLCVVARHHVHGLKIAQNTAALVDDEIRVAALDKEIQEALEELRQKDIIPAENDLDDNSERVISLKQYIETLNEPSFQVFESEYHLLRRLSIAESDLRTAIDLINHITAVLKILALAPKGEPPNYVSLWFKMISVCSQELKHGTWILKQSLEKNVHSELLSEEQGEQFIIALGEIYRAVLILGTAVKFYKPWILLSDADVDGIHGLLEECDSVWSSSGLQEVIPAESLLGSIRRIRNIDELAIVNEFLSKEKSQCRLSLLSPGVVPEMKMVKWNGDNYFLALANLWANLISPDPPKLAIYVG